MAQHEVEISISKTGDVRVHVKGAKGKACTAYAKWLAEIVGKVKDQQLTSEYYEPEGRTKIDLQQDLKVDDEAS
ncbi:MAG TPA: DUF2997 domain-containing protein [Sedimentisphaerales bacterium]|nr:DUF2997 domain-containing protein [Sedimentisphaerales bacterium]HRS12830.1 DUF2997 domain-containing protein [Sedimentisphaerales bacterium]HRV49445.1 DUF2997 domain-containing protein [Sedimentisphaerales bacterium]